MPYNRTRREITYEGTMVTLMSVVMLLALTLLIVGGILVTRAEPYF